MTNRIDAINKRRDKSRFNHIHFILDFAHTMDAYPLTPIKRRDPRACQNLSRPGGRVSLIDHQQETR